MLCCIMAGIASVLIWPDGNTGWTYDVHRFERSIMPPFYSYKEALHFAAASYHYLMINIGMFVPLGFVLPVGNTWFRKFIRTVGAAFFLALFMELGRCLATSTAIDPDNVVNHIKALPREIQVQDCTISYIADTKHFYQPVYVFQCKINNQADEIKIPCLLER